MSERRRIDPKLLVGGGVLLVLVAASVLAPWLPVGDATKIAAGPRLGPPSLAFPLGTDQLGRSNLPRVLLAIQSTFLVSAIAVLATALVATPLGLAAAYWRGPLDQVVSRIADMLFSIPPMLVAVLMAAILAPGPYASSVAVVIISLPLFVRVVRSAALSVAGRDFVVLARLGGAGPARIIGVHLLTNILGPLLVQVAYALSVGMLIESTLSFLGLGIQPPGASLGSLLYAGAPFVALAPWLVFGPGVVLAIIVIAVNAVTDALRDTIEPLEQRALQ